MIGQGIRMANNAGLVTTTGGAANDLLHTLTVGRKGVIRKVLWYNPLGVNINILLGTLDNTLPAALFVQLLPTIVAIPNLDGERLENEMPPVAFVLNLLPMALGTTGDIYVQDAGAGGLIIRLEIEEC